MAGGFYRIGAPQLQELPIKYAKEYEAELVELVDTVLLVPDDTDALNKIDSLVYKIYGLTEEEIAVVEATIN